ncbi:MAG TPA: ATP-binding protein [Gemmatimonadetes bacterium]|nr:ATP-binding protein [Gemmatimonadota bacterium]HIN79198.1 ATP-binding protein [Gemmatimonadota bacterium]
MSRRLSVVLSTALLIQIFKDLLENSVRHTDSGGLVHVTMASTQDSTVEVVISDDCEGIPTDALPRVFERFD